MCDTCTLFISVVGFLWLCRLSIYERNTMQIMSLSQLHDFALGGDIPEAIAQALRVSFVRPGATPENFTPVDRQFTLNSSRYVPDEELMTVIEVCVKKMEFFVSRVDPNSPLPGLVISQTDSRRGPCIFLTVSNYSHETMSGRILLTLKGTTF